MCHILYGPDGFNTGFFKRMWHIVGEDVINVVRALSFILVECLRK
jgi:hypothetical protein